MLTLVRELHAMFQGWSSDFPEDFNMVQWDDFVVGYLVGKGFPIADALSHVASDEYGCLMDTWESGIDASQMN